MCSIQLAAIKLGRYGEDLLFYLYYMNGGDLLQLLAAVELYVLLFKSFFAQIFCWLLTTGGCREVKWKVLLYCSFNRDWRYHKEERVWITRAPGMEPTLKTNTYERGTYYFFDCHNWRKVAKVKILKSVSFCHTSDLCHFGDF